MNPASASGSQRQVTEPGTEKFGSFCTLTAVTLAPQSSRIVLTRETISAAHASRIDGLSAYPLGPRSSSQSEAFGFAPDRGCQNDRSTCAFGATLATRRRAARYWSGEPEVETSPGTRTIVAPRPSKAYSRASSSGSNPQKASEPPKP